MKTREITVHINNGNSIKGNLTIPTDPVALIIFSHGSGSSRFSKRNGYVAEVLNGSHFATLLTDLLTAEEDRDYQKRFDIALLTERLITVTNYCAHVSDLNKLRVGYFGASTGAASALSAAAQLEGKIHAIVSRGGRPDLASSAIPKVKAPTLLLVGGLDTDVIALNKMAYAELTCKKDLRIIEGAGHLFEEGNKLETVATLAAEWFTQHLVFHGASLK
jgi:dienelactone hydrolase